MRSFHIRVLLLILCLLMSLPLVVGAQGGGEINIGDTITGELTVSQPSVTYRYQAQAGDALTLTLTSDAFDAFLSVEDTNGFRLASDDDSGGGKNARIASLSLPNSGVYLVIVDSFNRASSGAYTLTVEGQRNEPPVPSAAGTIENGQTVEGELTADALAASYTFTGIGGQPVTITLTSQDIDSFLTLKDAAGNTLATDDDGAGNLNSRIANFSLPADGTYTIVASSYNGATPGHYSLSFEAGIPGLPTGPTPTPIPLSPATPTPPPVIVVPPGTGTPITAGQPLTGSLSADAATGSFFYAGRAGEAVTITLTSATFDAYLTLQDAAGNVLTTDDDSAGNLNSRITGFVLPADGQYTIIASSFSGAAAGEFTVTVESGAVIMPTQVPFPSPTPVPFNGNGTGALVFGEPVSGQLTASQPTATFTFDGEAGQIVSITLTSNAFDTYLTLQDAAGNTLMTDDDSAGNLNSRISGFTLPANGSYQAVVSSFSSGSTGDYVIILEQGTIANVPPPTSVPTDTLPEVIGQVSADQTLTGELTTSRPRVAYQLLVEPGSAVSIALNSDAFDSYLTIMDAAGNVLASNDDGGGSLNSLIGAFSPSAGVTYYVVVSSLGGTDPGAYTLELKSVVVSTGGPINTGETLNGVSGGSSTLYTFTASAGDSITITLRSPDFDTFVRLMDADGRELASDDDSGGDLDSQIAFFTVPSDGTYTISVEAFGDNVAAGTYTLSLSTAVTRLIEYTQVIDANLTPDATDGYRFRGQAGDVITISMTSADFDSYLTLFDDATNTTLTTNDDGGGNRNALIGPFVLPATGDYLIAARSYGAGEGGAYTISLNKVILTPAAYGDAIQGSFDGSAPAVYYSFTGTSGDVVSLNVTSDLDTTLTVNDPNNYQAAFDDDGGAGYNPEVNRLVLSTSGTFTVIVGSYGGSVVGDFTLTINGEQPRSLDESAQQVELSDKRQQEALVFTGTAGQTVTVVARIISSGDSAAPILDVQQNGSSLAYQTLEGGNTVLRTDVTVPADGLVTVIVSDYSYQPIVIEVSLEKGG